MIEPLEPPDSHYLQAAQGWLDLGNYLEAEAEMDKVSSPNHAHPDVLQVRWRIFSKAEKWNACLATASTLMRIYPKRRFGWIHYAQSLHKLKRTAEARQVLYSAITFFEPNSTFSFYLACYACQLDKQEEAREWLRKAFAQTSSPEEAQRLKLKALDEPDLKPLWTCIDDLLK